MSVDLDIRLTRPVKINELLDLAQATLQAVLSVSSVPRLYATELEAGERHAPSTDVIDRAGPLFLVGIEGYNAEVALIVTEIEVCLPYVTEEETGLVVGISVGVGRTSLELALAASLAIALARLCEVTVIDTNDTWSSMPEQAPEDFEQAIAIYGTFDDLLQAADALYVKLPIGQRASQHSRVRDFLTRSEGSIIVIDLLTRLLDPIPLAELIPRVESALQELLAVTTVPRLRLVQIDALGRHCCSPLIDILDGPRSSFVVGLEGRAEEVTLTVMNWANYHDRLAEDTGLWAGISVTAPKAPMALALAAGVVLALARFGGTTVWDSWGVWSHTNEQTADDFAYTVAVRGQYADIQSAAEAMYAKLPVGQLIAEHG